MPRLLVADDASIIREIIKETALAAGWEIAGEAADGAEALARFRELQPDAVTLDMVMPGFDGRYALRAILDHNPAARVLVVSALDQRSVLDEAIRLGAAEVLLKPFARQALAASLHRLVSDRVLSA